MPINPQDDPERRDADADTSSASLGENEADLRGIAGQSMGTII